jgi:hypothetical protein
VQHPPEYTVPQVDRRTYGIEEKSVRRRQEVGLEKVTH